MNYTNGAHAAVSEHHFYGNRKTYTRAKTVCTSHVLAALGIDARTYHYSGTVTQTIAVLRKHYSARSVRSKLATRATVGGSRAKLTALAAADKSILGFVVYVEGHLLLLSCEGITTVDTDPRKRDARKVRKIYAVRCK